MESTFYDMNGNVINIGDICEPVNGLKVRIVSEEFFEEYNETVLIGQQIIDDDAYSILTHEALATNFKKVTQ